MNNKNTALLLSIALFFGSLIVPIAMSGQPPIITDTYLVGTIGQPQKLAPQGAYDTASGEIIMNVYESLIDFYRNTSKPVEEQGETGQFVSELANFPPTKTVVYKHLTNTTVVNLANPVSSNWTDGGANTVHIWGHIDNDMSGVLSTLDVVYTEEFLANMYQDCTTYVWTVENRTGNVDMWLKRTVYDFVFDTPFHDITWWLNATGHNQTGQTLTPADAEYSLELGIIMNQGGGPMWMYYLPMYDQMSLYYMPGYGTTEGHTRIGHLISCSIGSDLDSVWLSVGMSFPELAWYQILAQTWGAIVPKAFAVDHGCWNGTYFNGTGFPIWRYYRRWPETYYTPLDVAPATLTPSFPGIPATPTTKYSAHPDKAPTARGTGQYRFTYWHKPDLEVRMDKFVSTQYDWTGNHVATVIIKGVAEWTTRKMAFLRGDYDAVVVPRANMFELLDPITLGPLPGIVCNKDLPSLVSDSFHYQFVVAEDSPYIPKVAGVDRRDIFNNTYARKAFSYALNFTQYLAEAWYGEANQSWSWAIKGLSPDYRLEPPDITPYDINLTAVKENLKLAVYPWSGGQSLWRLGFTIKIFYNTGNDQRRIYCEMMESAIESLNTDPERTGWAPFDVQVVDLDWPVLLDYFMYGYMPAYGIGWLVDFPHPFNFVQPYMHSEGDFAHYQGYHNATVDATMTLALKTDNLTLQEVIYHDLQRTFIIDCPTLMIVQPLGRAWRRDWVQGWYYNPIYPGTPFYERWKAFPGPPPAPVEVDATSTLTWNGTDTTVRGFDGAIWPSDTVFNISATCTNFYGQLMVFVEIGVYRTFNFPEGPGTVPPQIDGYETGMEAKWDVLTPVHPTTFLEVVWNETECPYGFFNITGECYPFGATYDNNTANNEVVLTGSSVIRFEVLPPGDCSGFADGIWLDDLTDLLMVLAAWGSYPGHAKWKPVCDLDRTGVCELDDLIMVIYYWAQWYEIV